MIRIPTTIFSGFLGSGKTTIISHLIDELRSQNEEVIYIKNEIGDENVDGQIMEGKHIKTKELLNGCICCTLVGPFMNAIDEIADQFKPSRIIIEASGAADPSAIALMVSSHPRLFRDGVVSVVDVVNFKGYTDLSETARRQARFTDLIVFNKIELVDLQQKRAVVGYVRELNSHSPIIEAPGGRVHPDVIFGIATDHLTKILIRDREEQQSAVHHHQITNDGGESTQNQQNTPSDLSNTDSHLELDHIQTFHLQVPGKSSENAVLDFLSQLPNQVFRVKGFFLNEHGVQLVQKVGERSDITPAPEGTPQENTFVFIGFGISQLEDELHKRLSTCFQQV